MIRGFAIKLILFSVCTTCFVVASSHLFAATDGTLGADSTGDLDISTTIPDLVKITGISNLSFGSYGGGASISEDDDVCIYSNTSGNYTVKATGSGAASAFTVASGANTIAYTAKWNDQTGTSGSISLVTDVTSVQQSGANATSQNCGGGNNGNIQVTFAENDLRSSVAASYTGTLTLLISPSS